jgi:acyl-CoA reductase-like NAD-dependent aldehyde dehydrogenase
MVTSPYVERTEAQVVRTDVYVDGRWVPSNGREAIAVVDPTTAQPMGAVPQGSADDVAAAVAAARRAFEPWSRLPAAERADYLAAIGDAVERRADEIADLVAREVGMPRDQCLDDQVPVSDFHVNARLAREYAFEEVTADGIVLREPVGVVAAVTPWNYPLVQIAAKVAPALATGCTVVVKPSEVAPLNAFVLAEVVHEVGLPPGVFNLLSGDGPTVGEPLVSHRDVDMVSFTGSTRAGRRIGELAMQRVARLTLELGGKSPLVVLDDADLEQAVDYGVRDCFANSGQTCNALTRMLVPRSAAAEAAAIAARVADSITVGDPLSRGTELGPLVSEVQHQRVLGYIGRGIEEGATLVAGGTDAPAGLETGFFVRPTVFAGVTNDMALAREEIFGPVLVIIGYDDEDDAVRIANDSDYGLWGAVWSGSEERARAVARRLRVGGVSVNGAEGSDATPFGGYKQSGLGLEMGRFGFEEYLEVKALVV